MNEAKKILIISLDSDLFLNSYNIKVPGDPFLRHCKYQEILRKKTSILSEIVIIIFTNKKLEKTVNNLHQNSNIKIIGTNSFNRLFFAFDVIKEIFKLRKLNWVPSLITTQNAWGEAFLLAILSTLINSGFLPQIHTDISSKFWIKQNFIVNQYRKYTAYLTMKLSSHIRVVSDNNLKNISDKFKIDSKKFYAAPVPISLNCNKKEIINLINEKLQKNIFNIIYIGRFSKEKNLKLWIDSAFLILKKNPAITFTLIGYGNGKRRIEKIVESSNFKNNFKFLDKLDNKEIPFYLKRSNLFLLTSYYEGFGRVLLEAMNFGLPCICTPCGGPEDLIKNGENGFIVNWNAKSVSSACLKIINDCDLYLRMSNCSLNKAHRKFNRKKLNEKIIDIFLRASE